MNDLTVQELINKLSQMPQNSLVKYEFEEDGDIVRDKIRKVKIVNDVVILSRW